MLPGRQRLAAAAMVAAAKTALPLEDSSASLGTDGTLQSSHRRGMKTWDRFLSQMNWSSSDIDRTICHQVGSAHRDEILPALGLTAEQDFITYPYLGNIGTVSIPMTAALAQERGFLTEGQKVAFLGIGSGLVCRMLAWEWRGNVSGRRPRLPLLGHV